MSQTPPKILVFIPTYRCAAQITRVIEQFDSQSQSVVDTIMVVDNLSPDETLQKAIAKAQTHVTRCNFIAWKNDANYGLGGSHKAAFRYAIDHGFDYLVVLHGDDQGDFRDVVNLLAQGAHSQVDCLLGARFMRGSQLKGYSGFRTFGNRVYNTLFSLATLRQLHDLGAGLNVYKLASFREFYYKKFPDGLTFNYAMLLASIRRKQALMFFPISWREEDQLSNVKLFSQAFKVLGMLAHYFFRPTAFLLSEMRGRAIESYTGKIVHQQRKQA